MMKKKHGKNGPHVMSPRDKGVTWIYGFPPLAGTSGQRLYLWWERPGSRLRSTRRSFGEEYLESCRDFPLSFIIYHNHISFITAKHLIFQNDSYIWYINCILHVQHYTINVSPFMRTQFTTWETKPHPEVIDSHSHCPTTCVAAMVTVSLTRYRTPGKASPWWINQQSIVDRQKMPLFPKIRGPAHTQ